MTQETAYIKIFGKKPPADGYYVTNLNLIYFSKRDGWRYKPTGRAQAINEQAVVWWLQEAPEAAQ